MERQQQIARLQQLREGLDRQLAELERLMEREDPGWRRVHRAEADSLRRRREHAGQMLAELELAEAESWREEEFLTSLLAIFDHLGRRLARILGSAPSQ